MLIWYQNLKQDKKLNLIFLKIKKRLKKKINKKSNYKKIKWMKNHQNEDLCFKIKLFIKNKYIKILK